MKPPKRRPKVPQWVVPVVGLLVSGLSLYFSFRKFDYTQFGHDVRTLIWPWVILAIAAELTSYIIDSWRWLVILSPAEQPTLLQCVQATFIGVLGNDVLLLKAGELIRPFLLTRWARVPFSLSMTAAVVERIMDGVVMVTLFYIVTADISNTPAWMRDGMFVLSVSVAIIAAIILFVLFYRSHAHRIVSGRSWTAKFLHLLEEIHMLGNWRTLACAFAMSFFYFLCQFLAVLCLGRAGNFDFGLRESAFVLLGMRLVTMIPNAPGNVGTFQLAFETSLRVLMVESFNAKSFALIAYVVMQWTPALVGVLCVALTGMSIGEIHKQAHHAHRENEELRGGVIEAG
ncbi:lysylphosphatidylglycerol synthase transmembrane domain-containing protein [Nevskia soli]|jgi:uncharacterized protein (TIRG00374 family)|uniref:lysylphosphatidylglycerol synthase transmembrane domain-containing protein n=1 Tax=Nevskia soli TaxID=418856 RepID=UPI0015D71E4A|nr:lysylphosphatidylglycerol synthase transmembrane domain-containing protein [Nevskia soli]